MRTVFITDKKKRNQLSQLHELVTSWVKELNFILYEQEALQDIIETYCNEFCGFQNLTKTKKLSLELNDQIKKCNLLLLEIHTYDKQIATNLEKIYLKEEIDFLKVHNSIQQSYKKYVRNNKSLKKQIYKHTKNMMLKSKLRYLLPSPTPPKPYIPI